MEEIKAYRRSPMWVMDMNGFTKEDLNECVSHGMAPPCCSECYLTMVEPDGECKHGFPSIVIVMGFA